MAENAPMSKPRQQRFWSGVHDKILRFLRLLGVELAHASALPES
jgi:hypothetical protein